MAKKEQPPVDKSIDLDVILEEIGQFGRYQFIVYLYLSVAIIVTGIYNCNYVFNAGIVAYRCQVPECESPPLNFTPGAWRKFALPASGTACNRMVPVGKTCEPASFSNVTQRCNSWVYENNDTIVPEYGLACQEWRRTLVGTVHNAGAFAAIPLTAAVSDTYGRRHALIGTSVGPALFGMLRGFCYNYYLYLVLEFIEALVGAGTYSAAFILALEVVGLKKRVIGGNVLACTFAVGQMFTAIFAWAIPYWRTFTIVIFSPSFLFVFYYLFAEESVRWLLCHGKRKEAIRIIHKMARINRVKLMPRTLDMLNETPKKRIIIPTSRLESHIRELLEADKPKEISMCRQVLRSKAMSFRLCVCSFWWITTTLIYYGLSINSVSLPGGKYLNFILTSIVEIPAGIINMFTLDRFGRKASIMTSFLICSISLLVIPVITNAKTLVAMTLIAKMMISMIFVAIYIYTVELFPTQARHMLMGICSMMGRIGSMTAPQTPLLMLYMSSLPYLVFGGLSCAAGLLMLLTPETLHIKLPDTIAEAEQVQVAARTRKRTDLTIDVTH